MCLSYISDFPPEKSGYFWKVFRLGGRKGKTLYSEHFFSGALRQGRWLTADENKSYSPPYVLGFHGFKTKKDCIKWSRKKGYIRLKCEYQDATVQGAQRNGNNYLPVIVARKIRIPKLES